MPKKKRKKKKNKFFPVLRLVGILAFVLFCYLAYDSVKIKNIASVSMKFEQRLNKTLQEYDIDFSHVLGMFQTEEKEKGIAWVKFTKKIEIEPSQASGLVDAVINQAEKTKLRVYTNRRTPQGRELEVGTKNRILSHILFQFSDGKSRLAIIVDDLGYTRNIKSFLELDIPLTFSILPELPYSGFLAEEFKGSGMAYMLHMPMEPKGYPEEDPGEIALFCEMSKEQMNDVLEKALKSVYGAEGMNNHMGSKFTSDSKAMQNFSDILRERKLFFVDSATASDSLGYRTVRKYGVPVVINDFFIDNKDDYDYIISRLKKLTDLAKGRKNTVAICHITKKNTPKALKDYLPVMKKAGIKFVAVTDLLE